MNVVLYLRYSSKNQDEGSIDGQRDACMEFIKRKGYNFVREYIDREKTATSDNRPEFKKMLKDSNRGEFDAVLVYQFDRFARNRLESQMNKKLLKKNNVAVLSALEELPDDASKIIMEGMLETIAEYYSAELGQKVLRGMKTNANNFYYNGGSVPLGLKLEVAETIKSSSNSKDKVKKRFAVDKEKAPIIKDIFERFSKGETMVEIYTHLNNMGIRTSLDKPFNKNSMRRLLENKKYIGIYTYDGVETPGVIEPIISVDLFNKVQDRLEKYRCNPGKQKARSDYLLTTKLFCGYCENMMVGLAGTSRDGTVHNYYTCKGKKSCNCHKKNIIKKQIEDLVIEVAREVLVDEEIPIIAKHIVKNAESHDNSDLKHLQNKLKDLDKQKERLMISLKHSANEEVTKTIVEEMTRVETERTDTLKGIKEEEKNHICIDYDRVIFFLEEMRDGDVNDERYRQRLINSFINKVFLWDDKFIVTFNIKKSDVSMKLPEVKDLLCSFESSDGAPIRMFLWDK